MFNIPSHPLTHSKADCSAHCISSCIRTRCIYGFQSAVSKSTFFASMSTHQPHNSSRHLVSSALVSMYNTKCLHSKRAAHELRCLKSVYSAPGSSSNLGRVEPLLKWMHQLKQCRFNLFTDFWDCDEEPLSLNKVLKVHSAHPSTSQS